MERAIEIFALANLATLGVSHIVQHRAWAEFFVWLVSLGRPGVFCNAIFHFLFGTLIIAFHEVWSGLPVVLTVFGWLLTVKGTLYLCVPEIGARSMAMVTLDRSRRFIPVGFGLLVIAGVLAFALVRG